MGTRIQTVEAYDTTRHIDRMRLGIDARALAFAGTDAARDASGRYLYACAAAMPRDTFAQKRPDGTERVAVCAARRTMAEMTDNDQHNQRDGGTHPRYRDRLPGKRIARHGRKEVVAALRQRPQPVIYYASGICRRDRPGATAAPTPAAISITVSASNGRQSSAASTDTACGTRNAWRHVSTPH